MSEKEKNDLLCSFQVQRKGRLILAEIKDQGKHPEEIGISDVSRGWWTLQN